MSGALTHSIAAIMQQVIVDLSLADLPSAAQTSSDYPIFYGTLPDNPDDSILVSGTAGTSDGRNMIDGGQAQHHGFTVLVRSSNYATAFSKANAIKQSLDTTVERTSVTVASSVYRVQSVSTRPGPISLGKEELTKRELFTVNATVDLTQTT